jgi:hypothetical protein
MATSPSRINTTPSPTHHRVEPDALRHAGADVLMRERPGTHGDQFWREEFPQMVAWAFDR